jgi:AcrR family transcriptional regulator
LDRQQKYDDKLLLIVDKACGIFAEKGYHNASVRDVAAATGVSPAGLYYYFQSKEELLHLILESGLSSLMDRIREDVLGIQDPADRLRAIIRSHLAHFEKNGKEMRVLVHEWRALSGSFSEDIRRLMREYARVVTRTLQELSPDRTRKELRAATFGLFGMLTWVDQWYRPERDLPLDLLAGQFAGIYLDGIRSDPRTASAPGLAEAEDTVRGWVEKNSTSSLLSGPGF